MSWKDFISLDGFSSLELEEIKNEIEKKLRVRRIKYLESLECFCDRYTCVRCHELGSLR